MLTGCSNSLNKADRITVVTEHTHIADPIKPPRPKMVDEHWLVCQNETGQVVCMTPADAEKIIQNKIAIGRYADSLEAIIKYYKKMNNP